MTSNAEERRKWHVDKTLNIGHLLTTVVIASSVFIYASGMDKRVAVLEEKAVSQSKVAEQAQANTKELASDVKVEIRLLRSEITSILREKAAAK